MPDHRTISAALHHFDPTLAAARIEPCGGGFSGAQVWHVTAAGKEFALRAWSCEQNAPQDLRCQRALAIHSVMRQLRTAGLEFVPQPIENGARQSLLLNANMAWELLTWLPGEASYRCDPVSQPQKLRAAMAALAQWHVAAAKLAPPEVLALEHRPTRHWQTSLASATPANPPGDNPRFYISPGLTQRLARLADLRQQLLPQLRTAKIPPGWPELNELAPRLMEEFQRAMPRVEAILSVAASQPVPLQLCLRDLWHDHILFTGDRETGFSVSGIIDYDAMRVESVVGDLARLLGSLLGSCWQADRGGWQTALESYEAVRPLSDAERSLLPAFDCSSLAMTGMNWLDWIIVQQRTFSDRTAVLARLRENLVRLSAINASV